MQVSQNNSNSQRQDFIIKTNNISENHHKPKRRKSGRRKSRNSWSNKTSDISITKSDNRINRSPLYYYKNCDGPNISALTDGWYEDDLCVRNEICYNINEKRRHFNQQLFIIHVGLPNT